MAEKTRSIRLYVKRVFISDTFDEELIPRWLSFIKGVIDSSDLPLNVSREILQESRMTKAIRKQIVRRAIAMLEGLQEKQEDFKVRVDGRWCDDCHVGRKRRCLLPVLVGAHLCHYVTVV